MQIVNGDEYLEQANSRLTRETTIKAARGNILDCNGNVLAGNKIKYSLKLYKSKIDEESLNNTILKTINVLETNNDSYKDEFPIIINPLEYRYETKEQIKKWLEDNELNVEMTAEQSLNYFIQEYSLQEYSVEDARKIISIRYGIQKNGYTSMRGYEIASEISEASVAQFEEMNSSFPGIAIDYIPVRQYYYGSLASHSLGYVGKINSDEYKKNEGYDLLICDTAGRVQTKQNLMDELSKMNRIINKVARHEANDVLLIIDATTGQNGVLQAKAFFDAVAVTGIVLTKMDSTSKGGIILAIKDELNIPVKFVCFGEQLDDIQEFDLDNYLYGLTKGMEEQ